MWLRLAMRNVLRNPRRTVLSLAIIALGTGMIFATGGFILYINEGIEEDAIAYYGNLQIADGDLWGLEKDREKTLLDPSRVEAIEQVLSDTSGISGTTPQLMFHSQVQRGSDSGILLGLGVDPLNRIRHIYDIVQGTDLQPNDPGTIVVGRLLAEDLGVVPGDHLTLLIATVGGAFNTGRLRIVGVFRAYEEVFERQFAYVPLQTAQTLLNTHGVDQIIVRLDDVRRTHVIAEALRERLDATASGLAVRTWEDLGTEYVQTQEMFDSILGGVSFAIFVLVFFSILEVLTMAFMERVREVGTIRAIGTKRAQVFRLFLTEGLVLGVIGGLLGILVGLGLGALVNASGITWVSPGAIEPYPMLVRLIPHGAVAPLAIAVLSTLVSAVFPALHASRLRVVEAIRSV